VTPCTLASAPAPPYSSWMRAHPSSPIALLLAVAAPLLVTACATTPAPSPSPLPATAVTGPRRPVPYPLYHDHAFSRAIQRGTRTRSGEPGPRYWQQYARYTIEAELAPDDWTLAGRETVWYLNHSPDTLREVWLYLNQNLFAPDGVRNEQVPITEGMRLDRVEARGQMLAATDEGPGYLVDGTRLRVTPRAPVLPGDSIPLEFTWSFTIPPDGAPRSGVTGDRTGTGIAMMVAYWYPQLAVYDDVEGWHTDPYMARAEFYMGYADYDVRLTLPAGWLVGATGELVNANEVLSPTVRQRLAEARRTGKMVHVVGDADRAPGRSTSRGDDGKLTWHFRADSVRDVSFGASNAYLWDATIAVVGDRNGDARPDTTDIWAMYRPFTRRWEWDEAARYARHSIEFLSRYLWPYPYPHMLALDGPVSCSGMEYPMMTCIGGPRDTLALYSVIVHEFAHMWFPMQVGSDERRYAWQDEGLTRFNQAQGMQDFFKGYDREALARQSYLSIAGSDVERPLMTWGDLYPYGSPAYAVASYDKMATNMRSLRALLGDSLFLRAYREYGRRWIHKHPYPDDFFDTFEDVAGRDLDWFWRTWWYETWPLDQAIGEVRTEGNRLAVTIEDHGLAPMPVRLAITRANGAVSRMEVPVDVWLTGVQSTVVRIDDAASVRSIVIDPEMAFPDVNRGNNEWRR
jgi:hypothetical protein